jgi:hypothetical protein
MLRPQQFCLVLGLLAWGCSVYAQQQDCNKQIVTVAAHDKHDEFVSGLQKGDFQAKVRGKGADILSVAAGAAQRVVLVLDVSGSMASKWGGLQRLSSKVINASPENTQFALIIFAGQVLETVEFGHSREEVLSAINQFAAIPRTTKRVVRDSLLNAYDLLQPAQAGDSILVATNERDNDSKVSEKTLGNKFNSEGIRFFVMRVIDPLEDTKFLHNELELLSTATAGAEISIESPNQTDMAARMADEIAQYYLLQIALPEPLVKDGSLQLEVINSARQKRKGVELRFPEKLPACTDLGAHQ